MCKYMHERVGADISGQLVLTTDDIWTEVSLSLFSRHFGKQSMHSHFHCHPPFEELLNQSQIKGRISCRKTTGQRVGGRNNNYFTLICQGSRAEHQIQSHTTVPHLLPPSIFLLPNLLLPMKPVLHIFSPASPCEKYIWWPKHTITWNPAALTQNNLPGGWSGQKKRHNFEKIQYGCTIRIKMLLMRFNSSSILLLLV